MIAGDIDKALRAAGVPIVGVSVGRATDKATWRVDFAADATSAQRAAAQAVLDAFDPASVKPERRVDFENAMRRLTNPEWSALKAACDNSVQLARWYERAKTRGSIDLNDAEVKQALGAVIQAGLFTKARLVELFAASLD